MSKTIIPSEIKTPWSNIPVISYKKSDSPVVWLTACSHGDEVGGVAVIHEVFKTIKEKMVKGSLYAFPMINPIAFDSGTRMVKGEDLNRSFPGSETGSIAKKTANHVFSTIMKSNPDIVIDLHNDWTHSIPYVIVDPIPGRISNEAYKLSKFIARGVGFVVVEETIDKLDNSTVLEWKKTLSGSLITNGVPALTIELGESRVINEENVKMGTEAIYNVLSKLGMISNPSGFIHPSVSSIGNEMLYYSGRPRSSTSGGMLIFKVKPGEVIKKGQILAKVYDILGKEIEIIRSESSGVILGHAEVSVAKPETPLIAIATK